MQVDIQMLMDQAGQAEPLYPGKKVVQKLPQPGEHKSHCVVYDWRHPALLRVDIKAGLSGRDLLPKELKRYPISFQSPTYFEIAVNENKAAAHAHDHVDADTDEDEEDERGGKSGGGGKGLKKRSRNALNAFTQVVKGEIPASGEIKKMVLMGKEIAKGAYETVLNSMLAQIRNMAVVPVNLLASVTNVTKVAPGGRPQNEINPDLLKGAKPYKPKQDMFGPITPG